MRVDTWRLYPVMALAVLAGASAWLERITRVDDAVLATGQSGPDFIAHDTRVVGFGADGRQRYELVAPKSGKASTNSGRADSPITTGRSDSPSSR